MWKKKRFNKSIRLLCLFLVAVLMCSMIRTDLLLAAESVTTEVRESTEEQEELTSEAGGSTEEQEELTSEAGEGIEEQEELTSEAGESTEAQEELIPEEDESTEVPDNKESENTVFDFAEESSEYMKAEVEITKNSIVPDIDGGMHILSVIQSRAGVTYEINLAEATSGQTWGGATFNSGALTFNSADPADTYLIYTSLSGTVTTSNHIVISSGVEVNIIIDRVTIDTSDAPIHLASGADVNLILNGANKLSVNGTSVKAGISVSENAILTINETEFGGSLLVELANLNLGGAAIGSNLGEMCGTIRIKGGSITANANSVNAGAAIGSGKSGDFQAIEISGGQVKAIAGGGSAGIGGAIDSSSSTGKIEISGGEVEAIGAGGSAGIGSGAHSVFAGTITISAGQVTATGNSGGAGIGGGIGNSIAGGSNGSIEISGGQVTAAGSSSGGGAGIGGGDSCGGNIIIISGGEVTATGRSKGAAGIGGSGTKGTNQIEISGGVVTATGSDYIGIGTKAGAGIGGGNGQDGGTITISGGTVTASGGKNTNNTSNILIKSGSGAGIGGSGQSSAGTITISGGIVTASGGQAGNYGNDIGSGGKGSNNSGTGNSIVFIGGSIYPEYGVVLPYPTNGSANGSDQVYMLSRPEYAGKPFVITAASSVGTYLYSGTGHPTTGYIWLSKATVSVSTNEPELTITRATVQAPTDTLSLPSGTALLKGSVISNSTSSFLKAYFEWGTGTGYEFGEIPVSIALSSPSWQVFGLSVGTTYHYRYVLVTNSGTIYGEDVAFTPAETPSVDATHSPNGTGMTLYGIYNLNGGDFVGGTFEISTDGDTWTILTETTTPAISSATGVNMETGQLSGLVETPSVSLTGLSTGTYYYRFSVTNSKGTEAVEDSFEISGYIVTIESKDMSGALLAKQPNPNTTLVSIGGEYSETAVAAQLTSGGITYRADHYILSTSPTEKHSLSTENPKIEAFSPANDVTITVYYISTMIDIAVPSGVEFHSTISDNGNIAADNNSTFTNYSELAVKVGLQKMTVNESSTSEKLTFVSDIDESTVYRRLHLNLVPSNVAGNSFTNAVNNIIPDSAYASPVFLGTLDGTLYTAEGTPGTNTGGSGTFEVGGRYVGDYPVNPLKYNIDVTFEFCLEITG